MTGADYRVYASRGEGIAAAGELLEGNLYSGLTVAQVVERYEGYQPTPFADLPASQQRTLAIEAARNQMSPQAFLNQQNAAILQHTKEIASDIGVSPTSNFDQSNLDEVSGLTSQLLIFENGNLNRSITPAVVKQDMVRYGSSLST